MNRSGPGAAASFAAPAGYANRGTPTSRSSSAWSMGSPAAAPSPSWATGNHHVVGGGQGVQIALEKRPDVAVKPDRPVPTPRCDTSDTIAYSRSRICPRACTSECAPAHPATILASVATPVTTSPLAWGLRPLPSARACLTPQTEVPHGVVLVVLPDTAFRSGLQHELERMGFEVIAASDWPPAIEAASARPAEGVVFDSDQAAGHLAPARVRLEQLRAAHPGIVPMPLGARPTQPNPTQPNPGPT